MSILKTRRLTIRFGGLTAVSEVDVEIAKGQIYSIIGPNGAGKTTVFNAVTGIYAPTEGEILFEDSRLRRPLTAGTIAGFLVVALACAAAAVATRFLEPLWVAGVIRNFNGRDPFPWGEMLPDAWAVIAAKPGAAAVAGAIGFLLGALGSVAVWARSRRTADHVCRGGIARTFQNIRLFHGMTVLENVQVALESRRRAAIVKSSLVPPGWRRSEDDSEEKARELLRFVNLEHRAGMLSKNLPYGDQRRLEIARAMATGPRLLLLDEPAAGMNPTESRDLMKLIQRIQAGGMTVLLIEHHMRVVMGISDQIAVLDHGVKIADGPPQAIQADPKVLEAYLGKETVE